MQVKKTISSVHIGVSLDDRLALRTLREELRAARATLDQLWQMTTGLRARSVERHPLAVASASLWVAAKDVGVALTMVQEQQARWEQDVPTRRIRWPVEKPEKS